MSQKSGSDTGQQASIRLFPKHKKRQVGEPYVSTKLLGLIVGHLALDPFLTLFKPTTFMAHVIGDL